MRRVLTRADLERDPHAVWNTFIEIIATGDPAELTTLQQQAQLVFYYDSEVYNGGHGQYLENMGLAHAVKTVDALPVFGLGAQARVLAGVVQLLQVRGGAWDEVLEDGVIEALDDAFHACVPTVHEAFEQHLVRHSGEHIEFV